MTTQSSSDPISRSSPESLGFCPRRLERIGAALQAEIAAGKLPGAVLAIARHGKLAFFEAFGCLDKQADVPMRRDAVFSIASMTKPLVSVAALTLYEEGRLMVNEPVGKYLPQLAHMSVAAPGANAEGTCTMESVPARRQMTIQDLMRHTAGLTYGNRGSTAFHKRYPSSSDVVAGQMTGSEFLRTLAGLPLHFQPGSAWDYGFGLGVAVRRRAGGGGMASSAGEFHWAGATGPYFWVDPSEALAVVFMAHAPGALRFYYRQLLHALVLQALE